MERLAPILIRPAGRRDLEKFYGTRGAVLPTVVALVGIVDGEIVGVGGISRAQGRRIAFCDVTDAGRRYKMAIVRAGRRLMSDVAKNAALHKRGANIFARLDPNQAGAERFLASLGFRPLPDHEGVFRWQV